MVKKMKKMDSLEKLKRTTLCILEKNFGIDFTGEEDFYKHICLAAGEVAKEVNLKDMVEEVVEELSGQIEERFNSLLN